MEVLKEHTVPTFRAEEKNTQTSKRLHGIISPAMAISTATARKISCLTQINITPALPPHFLKIRTNTILPSMLWYSKWSLLLQVSLTKVSLFRLMHVYLIFDIPTNTTHEAPYAIFFSHLLLPPLHNQMTLSVLRHLQSMFFPPYERPSYTTVQNRQNDSTVYFNLYFP